MLLFRLYVRRLKHVKWLYEILPQRKLSSPATSGSLRYHSPPNYLIAPSTEDGLIPRCVRAGACVRPSICGRGAHARPPARSRLSVWILAPPRYTCSCPCVCVCASGVGTTCQCWCSLSGCARDLEGAGVSGRRGTSRQGSTPVRNPLPERPLVEISS